jgi:hypothetical protein
LRVCFLFFFSSFFLEKKYIIYPSITVYREIYSKKRKLSNVDAIDRKATSIRADQLIRYGNYELGIVEASKVDDEYSSKFFLDSMKKTPKSMKDMLLQLVKAAPTKKNSLRTIGMIISSK